MYWVRSRTGPDIIATGPDDAFHKGIVRNMMRDMMMVKNHEENQSTGNHEGYDDAFHKGIMRIMMSLLMRRNMR